jgi:hypothetical protein
MMSCSRADSSRHFGGAQRLDFENEKNSENGGSNFPQNVHYCLTDNIMLVQNMVVVQLCGSRYITLFLIPYT